MIAGDQLVDANGSQLTDEILRFAFLYFKAVASIHTRDQRKFESLRMFHAALAGEDDAQLELKYAGLPVVCDTLVPIDEVHFFDLAGELVGKIVHVGEVRPAMKPRFVTWKGELYAICKSADGTPRGIYQLDTMGFAVPGYAWRWQGLTLAEEMKLRKEADLGPR